MQVVEEMKTYYNTDAWNHWGRLDGNTACPLACLKCNRVMYKNLSLFMKDGPQFPCNLNHCPEHAERFRQLMVRLSKATKGNLALFDKLVDSVREKLFKLEKIINQDMGESHKSWEYYDLLVAKTFLDEQIARLKAKARSK